MTAPFDSEDRPVVFETKAESGPRRPRLHIRALATMTGTAAALAAATGIAFGGSALWSALDTKAANNVPAPLWIPPPPQVTAALPENHPTTATKDDSPESTKDSPTTTHQPLSTVDSRGTRVTTTTQAASPPPAPQTSDDRGGSSGRGGGGGGGGGRSPGGP